MKDSFDCGIISDFLTLSKKWDILYYLYKHFLNYCRLANVDSCIKLADGKTNRRFKMTPTLSILQFHSLHILGAHGRFVPRGLTRREARIQTLVPDRWMSEVERYGHGTQKVTPQTEHTV